MAFICARKKVDQVNLSITSICISKGSENCQVILLILQELDGITNLEYNTKKEVPIQILNLDFRMGAYVRES
jgi:hypothetical protein